jgi:hypothetical protein
VIDASMMGSVISITAGSPVVEGLTLTGGWAREGAGIYIRAASPTLRDLVITGNTISATIAERTHGAGVYIWSDAVTLDHCDVVSNTAYSHPERICVGAGIHIHSSSGEVTFVATRIMHNVPAGGADVRGGGIGMFDGPVLRFLGDENLIAYNEADRGGGIRTRGHITGATVMSNTAEVGGGVFLDGTRDGVVANCIIVGNRATAQGAGVMLNAGGSLVNSTVVANRDGMAGVVVGTGTTLMTLTNNIIVSHEVGLRNRSALSPTLLTNDLWSNELNYSGVVTGATDLHVDPLFVDAAAGDYHLTAASRLIDAGTLLSDVKTDFDGDPRPIGASHDVGADEWGRFVYVPLVMR